MKALVCVKMDLGKVYEEIKKRYDVEFINYYDERVELRDTNDIKDVIQKTDSNALVIYANFEYAIDLLATGDIDTAFVIVRNRNPAELDKPFVIYCIEYKGGINKFKA